MARKPPPPGKPVTDALPKFPLFEDPVAAEVLEKSKSPCDCCGQSRGWVYTGPIYLEDDDEPTVCPWCIADGAAAAKFECRFNDAGVISHHPGDERDPPAAEMDEVEQRTPGFDAWQGNYWFACCGHTCVFLGDADADDLQARWAAAVPTIIANAEGAFDAPEELIDALEAGDSVGVFVFRCSHCGKLGGYIDLE
jgi:uncharacterized protein